MRLHALGYEKEFAFLEKIHGRDKTGIVPPQPDEIIPLEELDDMKLPKLLTDRCSSIPPVLFVRQSDNRFTQLGTPE